MRGANLLSYCCPFNKPPGVLRFSAFSPFRATVMFPWGNMGGGGVRIKVILFTVLKGQFHEKGVLNKN